MGTKKVSLVVGILAVAILLSGWKANYEDAQERRLVTVTGNAEVRVVPDEVILVLGVETWDTNLQVAKAQNDERVKRVLALSDHTGIAPQHIKTDYINIQPGERGYEEREGYWVRKTIIVTLEDLSKFEAFLADVLNVGVTHVHEVQFRTTQLREHKDQARALAIKAAKDKADALAAELDQKVGEPFEIHEDHSGWWYSSGAWWGPRWGGGMNQNVIQEAGGSFASAEGSIAPGQITVDARISVSFTLLP